MTRSAVVFESHISTVLLIGDRAYKFMKPIATPFLDQSTPMLRREACERELNLNRQFAPDVYLGLGEVREFDVITDTFLVMRRLPEEARLSLLVGQAGLKDAVREVARVIAAFHTAQPVSAIAQEMASAESVAALWNMSLDQMEAEEHWAGERTELATIRRLAMHYIAGRQSVFERRIAQGWAKPGHGDLLAEDVFVLPDGVRILDCLAFDERLRCGDVLLDVAFLAMDLERLGAAEAADELLAVYDEFTNERHPASLAHHYIAYRALVRAKVRGIRGGQGSSEAAIDARAFLAQCLRHLRLGAPVLTLVGGNPGVGKTTVAEQFGSADGTVVLSTDLLRKELAGLEHTATRVGPLDEGIYAPAFTATVYDELLRRTDRLLREGESVVLDATWQDNGRRAGARAVAVANSAELLEIRCVLDQATAAERIRRRAAAGGSASDATVSLSELVADRTDPWPEATELATSGTPEDVEARVRERCRSYRDNVGCEPGSH